MSKKIVHPFADEMQTTPPTSINPASRTLHTDRYLGYLHQTHGQEEKIKKK